MSQRIEQYREFCQLEKNIPVFSQPWWLDAVCGKGNWDVALVEKGGQIFATLPYFIKRRAIFSIIIMPNLTQTMGPYIKYPKNQKYYKKISWEHKMLEALIKQLPRFDKFAQNFHHSVTNGLPFYWHGFSQTTYYTYVIDKNITLDTLTRNFETDIRRRRRKAEKIGITIVEDDSVDKFYTLNLKTFTRQNKEMPYSKDFINSLYQACRQNNAGKVLCAKDASGAYIASMFLIFDTNTVYYLAGGIEPDKKDLGAMDMLLFEGIKFAVNSGKNFDFEGSMVQSIEKYFRSFGAQQVPYFSISKTNSMLLKFRKVLQEVF